MIKWNKVTWYSKLLATILFLIIIPTLAFYIGVQYEFTKNSTLLVPSGSTTQLSDGKHERYCPKINLGISPNGFGVFTGDDPILINLASRGNQSLTFSLQDAPAWLTLQSGNLFAVHPPVGKYKFEITAINDCGAEATTQTTLDVSEGVSPRD